MSPMIPKEMKYNLHYDKVRGDVLPSPHGTNTSLYNFLLKMGQVPCNTLFALMSVSAAIPPDGFIGHLGAGPGNQSLRLLHAVRVCAVCNSIGYINMLIKLASCIN